MSRTYFSVRKIHPMRSWLQSRFFPPRNILNIQKDIRFTLIKFLTEANSYFIGRNHEIKDKPRSSWRSYSEYNLCDAIYLEIFFWWILLSFQSCLGQWKLDEIWEKILSGFVFILFLLFYLKTKIRGRHRPCRSLNELLRNR